MSPRAQKVIQLNGRFLPAERAQISVFDRGLLYGDGLFETLRTYCGRPFALGQHLARLQASADFLGFAVPRRTWHRDIELLLKKNGLLGTDAWVRITLTRGVGARGLLPPATSSPTMLAAALLPTPFRPASMTKPFSKRRRCSQP